MAAHGNLESAMRRFTEEASAQTHPQDRVLGARERLLAAAFVLFYKHGIKSVGIDRIIAEAGAAKASFYHHFRSKDELIVAYVELRYKALMAVFSHEITSRASDPHERLLVAFDVLGDFFADPEFSGCPVNNAVAEVGRGSPEVRDAACRFKADVAASVAETARDAGVVRVDELVGAWILLIDGAFVGAQRGDEEAAASAKATARVLLEGFLPST
jgi:AcrR family transcriptional regulator